MKKVLICALAVVLTFALASCQIIDTIINLGKDTAGSTAVTDKPTEPAVSTEDADGTGNVTDPATQSETDAATEPQQSETEPYIDPAPQLLEETLLDADYFALYGDLLYIGSALRSVGADFDDPAELSPTQAFRAVMGETEHKSQTYEEITEGEEQRQKTVTVYADDAIDARTEIRFRQKYNLKGVAYVFTDVYGDEHDGRYAEGEGVVVTWTGSAHGGTFSHQECDQLIEQKFSDGGVLYRATVSFYVESEAPETGYESLYKFIEDGYYDTWVKLSYKYEVLFRDVDGAVSVISYHPVPLG